MVKVSGLPNCQLSLMFSHSLISTHYLSLQMHDFRLLLWKALHTVWRLSKLMDLGELSSPMNPTIHCTGIKMNLKKSRKRKNTAEMPWQHTLKADLHSHGPFNVTSNERYNSAERKRWVYLQVQPCWDVETYGDGEKEIRRTLMWLSKVHWTTCDNSLSSCIYSFNVCSSLGDNCLNWYSKCYCFCVCREINSCGVPLCMSGCLISQCILIFNSLWLGFLLSFNLSAS